jgi:hypothetical protein
VTDQICSVLSFTEMPKLDYIINQALAGDTWYSKPDNNNTIVDDWFKGLINDLSDVSISPTKKNQPSKADKLVKSKPLPSSSDIKKKNQVDPIYNDAHKCTIVETIGREVHMAERYAIQKGDSFKVKPKGACWNCSEVGHLKNKCPKLKKDSPSSSSNANAAVSDSEEEGAFFMELDSEDDEIVILNKHGDDDGRVSSSDDCDRAESGWDTEELSGVDRSETSSLVNVDLDSVAAEAEELVTHADESLENDRCTEILDSGCSHHLAPYRESLTNYVEIEPKTFRAVNKCNMKAVGKGNMSIDVPNRDKVSKLKLTEVLYSPEVGYSLGSMGRLDKAGYTITFGGGRCLIADRNGEDIGSVPMTDQCLYKLEHISELAGLTEETLTLDEAHQQLSHISYRAVHRLMQNHFVMGILRGPEVFCDVHR